MSITVTRNPRVSGPSSVSSAIKATKDAAMASTSSNALATAVMQSAKPHDCGVDHDHAENVTLGRKALAGLEGKTAARTPPKYFRTYEQVKAAIADLAKKYPQFVSVVDIGDSFEKTTGKADRDLLVMKLTSQKAGPKAKVFFFGGQHAREIANPELLMRFATWLLEGYGKDAEATAILDNCQIDLLPIMNPDGHAVVERGYTGEPDGELMKRKNTSGKGGQGTDLNRNWASKNWGTAGTSHSQSSETYAGPSPASEPETQAMQNYITESKPQFLIDWHSYSELVLYPPEDSRSNTTPDQEHFVRVGKKMASFNRYKPQASIELYPTSGTSQWAYEKHQIPSFVLETGTAFHQTDAQWEDNWKRNFPVMKYVASIAHDWKKASLGPDISAVRVDGAGLISGVAVDAATGKPAVKAELVLDATVAAGKGTAVAVNADGTFSLQTQQLAPGSEKKLMYVRAQDADGNWGPLAPLWQSVRANRANLVATRVAQAKAQRAS